MLNPQMNSWGFYELTRRQAQAAEERRKPQPTKLVWARGSMEWQAHNALHLGKKPCPPRRLGVALKPHCRQRQLLHPPTYATIHPRRIIPRSLQLAFAEVP